MWAKVKAACLYSLTIAWSYCLAIVGIVMQSLDVLTDALGDPNLKDQIAAAIGDTRTVGRILLGVSIVTMIVRMRTARRAN
jgi:hypothetical protein